MKKYVAGFMFSPDRKRVLLIEKNRPDFQKGKLNGIGGKVEKDESFSCAMVREFREETGVDTTHYEWTPLARLSGNEWEVGFYYMFSDKYKLAASTTDEKVYCVSVNSLRYKNIMPNLSVLIPLALDESGLYKPVMLYDGITPQ